MLKKFIHQQEVHGWLRHLLDKFATEHHLLDEMPKEKERCL
jgi:hypothetical protein